VHNVAKGSAVADGLKLTGTTVCFVGTVTIPYPLLDMLSVQKCCSLTLHVMGRVGGGFVGVRRCAGRIRDLSFALI
jgi:hypothetical protein